MRQLSIKPKAILWGENLEILTNKWLQIRENRILNVGDEALKNSKIIKKPNTLLIPGLIDAHTHIGDAAFKDIGWNLTIKELVKPPYGLKHKLLTQTPKKIVQEGIQNAIQEMISNGITSFVDFREGGMKGISFLKNILSDIPISYKILGRTNSNSIKDWYNFEFDGFGLSSIKNYDENCLFKMKQFTQLKKKNLSWHLAECHRYEDRIDRTLKIRPDYIVHGTHLNNRDLDLFYQNNIGIVFCPRSNMMLNTGIPPLIQAMKKGIKIGLGTDNSFVNSLDIFQELREVTRFIRNNDEGKNISAKQIFKLATVNSAICLGIESQAGWLDKNKLANFILINLSSPNLYCQTQNYFRLLVNRVSVRNITQVYSKGKLVYSQNHY